MRSRRRALALATSLLVALPFAGGCASIGLEQSLDPQLEQVRALRASLEADWKSIGDELTGAERDLATLGNQRVDTDRVDPAVLRDALETIELPEDASAEDAEAATEQAEARMAAYRDSLENLDDDARAKVERMRDDVSRLGARLHEEIPARLTEIAERADDVTFELAEIKAKAEQTTALADQNPLMSASEKRKVDQDMATLDREIASLADLAQQIGAESAICGQRLATASTTFSVEVASMRK